MIKIKPFRNVSKKTDTYKLALPFYCVGFIKFHIRFIYYYYCVGFILIIVSIKTIT